MQTCWSCTQVKDLRKLCSHDYGAVVGPPFVSNVDRNSGKGCKAHVGLGLLGIFERRKFKVKDGRGYRTFVHLFTLWSNIKNGKTHEQERI